MLSLKNEDCFIKLLYGVQMTYGERLQKALDLSNKTRKALALELGISEQAVSQVIRGGRSGASSLTAPNSALAARFLRVNHHWLATGEGDPHEIEGWPFPSFGPDEYYSLDPALRMEVEDRLLGAITRHKRSNVA